MDLVPYLGSKADIALLSALFRAASCDCYCRYWHFEGDKNDWQARLGLSPEDNEKELVAADPTSDAARGLLLLDGGVAIGWAKLVPLALVPKLTDHRYYRSLLVPPREGEWAVACFLVHPEHRGRGVAKALADGALEQVRAWGGKTVVGFPRAHEGKLLDEEHWRGPKSAYVNAGFEVAAGDPTFPVMRKT